MPKYKVTIYDKHKEYIVDAISKIQAEWKALKLHNKGKVGKIGRIDTERIG